MAIKWRLPGCSKSRQPDGSKDPPPTLHSIRDPPQTSLSIRAPALPNSTCPHVNFHTVRCPSIFPRSCNARYLGAGEPIFLFLSLSVSVSGPRPGLFRRKGYGSKRTPSTGIERGEGETWRSIPSYTLPNESLIAFFLYIQAEYMLSVYYFPCI